MSNKDYIVIELIVRNHPGVMSHITGLFSRRGFNLEGILCGYLGDPSTSQMYLLVENSETLEQIIKQLQKLYDVIFLKLHREFNKEIFENLNNILF